MPFNTSPAEVVVTEFTANGESVEKTNDVWLVPIQHPVNGALETNTEVKVQADGFAPFVGTFNNRDLLERDLVLLKLEPPTQAQTSPAESLKAGQETTENAPDELDFEVAQRAQVSFTKGERAYNQSRTTQDAAERQRALEYFNNVIRLIPGHPQALTYRGHIRFESGEYELARQDYGEAIRVNPELDEAHTGLAQATIELVVSQLKTDEESARQTLDDTITEEYKQFWVYVSGLTAEAQEIGKQNPMESSLILDEVIRICSPRSNTFDGRLGRGKAYYFRGKCFEQLATINPSGRNGRRGPKEMAIEQSQEAYNRADTDLAEAVQLARDEPDAAATARRWQARVKEASSKENSLDPDENETHPTEHQVGPDDTAPSEEI